MDNVTVLLHLLDLTVLASK